MDFLSPTGELSDEELQQLIELGIIPEQTSSLDKQIATAEALRYGAGPEMRGNGRVQTAANPLEFLAHGLQGYRAGKDLEELRNQQAEMLRQQTEGRKLFYRKMFPGTQQDPGLGPMPTDSEEYL
jgi:hypothetical protein